MKELSKVEMEQVSGAGTVGNILGDIASDIAHSGDVAVKTIANVFTSIGKIATDSVFNLVRGFWEGRYLR